MNSLFNDYISHQLLEKESLNIEKKLSHSLVLDKKLYFKLDTIINTPKRKSKTQEKDISSFRKNVNRKAFSVNKYDNKNIQSIKNSVEDKALSLDGCKKIINHSK